MPTRRNFFALSASAALAQQARAQADPVRFGIIGVGNIGARHLQRRLLPFERRDGIVKVVAASDIYDRAKLRAKEMIGLGDRDVHHRYEDLLARDDVDAVLIATPDHWHAKMAIDAMEAGKDVYLEKPISRTIEEARRIAETVERTGRVLQVGSQWVSDPAYHEAKKILASGEIGQVAWAQSTYTMNHPDGVWQYYVDEEATPETIDWERFLGDAPAQPFSGERFFRWRKYWDFSGGMGTDFFYHRLSPLMFALGPRFPLRVSAHGGVYFFQNRQVPDTYSTTIEYERFGIEIFGTSAAQAPNRLHGPAIFGQRGTIEIHPGEVRVVPEKLYAEGRSARTIAVDNRDQQSARTAHMLNFIECVRTRAKPVFNARFGYQVMVAIKLGVDSYRQCRMMGFDPATERVLEEPLPRPEGFEGDGANDPDAPAGYQKRPIA